MFEFKSIFTGILPSSLIRMLSNERGEFDASGEGEGSGAAGDVQQQLTDLRTVTETLKSENESLKGLKTTLEQRISETDQELLSDDYLEWKDNKGKSPKGSSSSASTEELGIDLDRASNREIAGFIEKKYKGDLDVAVKDIRKELDLSKRQLGMIAAQFDVALTTIRHDGKDGSPSFNDNKKEIFVIAKANPKWDAERCYQQYVLESKAQRDKNDEEKRRKADEDDKAATEKSGVPLSITKGKQLTKEEAADIAYRKAFGNAD